MGSNISISYSGGTAYVVVDSIAYSSADGKKYGNSVTAVPNTFYDFGSASLVFFTLSSIDNKAYQEYMFEFTALEDNVSLSVKSSAPLYWARPIEPKKDHTYQFSVVNGVVLWVEVSTV